MATPDHFLGPEDLETFNRPERFLRRTATELPLHEDGQGKPQDQLLVDFVLDQLRQTTAKGAQFGSVVVQVRSDDGMSWSAESVNAAVREQHAHLPRWCLVNPREVGQLPVVASFIGETRLLQFAAAEKLTTSFFTWRSWVTVAAVAAVLLAGAAVKVAEIALKGRTSLADPLAYVVALGLAGLLLLSQFLTSQLTSHSKANSRKTFLERFGEQENEEDREELLRKEELLQKNVRYQKFVDRLAREVSRLAFPRVVVIDDFERLDWTTRHMIERYFTNHATRGAGLDFWVAFERRDPPLFSNFIVNHRETPGARDARVVRQRFLSDSEKRTLAERIGKPERATLTTVKEICSDGGKTERRMSELLRQHRDDHPRQPGLYGDLEFLYLIGLTMLPEPVPISSGFLDSRFAAKSGLRSSLLSQLLQGTPHARGECVDRIRSISTEFTRMVELEETRYGTQIQIATDAAQALITTYDRLGLPPPGLGHVFWSIFWSETMTRELRERREPFWIRKVTHHLVLADVSVVADAELRGEVAGRLFEAILGTIDAALATCFFRHVPTLLERAFFLLQDDERGPNPANQRRFLQTCWTTYSILGHEQVLQFILELTQDAWSLRSVSHAAPELRLDALFLESIALPPVRRAVLSSGASGRPAAAAAVLEAAADHARMRAGWLALSVAPLLGVDERLGLRDDGAAALAALEKLTQRTYDRLVGTSDESIRVTDVLTLSLSLWCHALAIHVDTVVGIDLDSSLAAPAARFGTLLERAQDAVALAAELRKDPAVPDFILSALARELCAMAIASAMVGYHHLKAWTLPVENPSWGTRFADIMTSSSDVLQQPLPTVRSLEDAGSKEVADAVVNLMSMCHVVWSHFGLDRMRDFLNVRRIYFRVVAQAIRPKDYVAYRPLVASIDLMTEEGGFAALLANLVFAVCQYPMAEMVSNYVNRAASVALESEFGERLTDELAYLAVSHGHSYTWELQRFLARILEARDGGLSFAASVLETEAGTRSEELALPFLNVAIGADDALWGRVIATIDRAVEKATAANGSEELRALRDSFLLRRDARLGRQLDVAAVLEQWHQHRHLWLYANVLRLLLHSGYATKPIIDDALAVLERDQAADKYNAYLNLALAIATLFQRETESASRIGTAVAYIKASASRWEPQLAAEVNLEVYRVLYTHDPEQQARYATSMEKWEAIKIERDHLQRLPALVRQGRYFLVFDDYVDSMGFWGLSPDVPAAELRERFNVGPERAATLVRQWKASGATIPDALVRDAQGTRVSAEFLCLGRYLFGPPIDRDPSLQNERTGLDAAAKVALKPLLSAIIDLPGVPPSLKDLLQTYGRRLLEHTLPQQ